MIVKIEWQEPEDGDWSFTVSNVTDQELQNIRTWAKQEAGSEWGVTIPSITLDKGEHWEVIPMKDFASSIRYDTGEKVYSSECPEFKKRGIRKS